MSGPVSGLFGSEFGRTKNGNKRSMASQIRFRKTLEATIPPTLLLDGRLAMGLQPVKEPKQKLEEMRSGPVTTAAPENEMPKLTDPRLLAEIQKFKLPRNPAKDNHLLILEPVLCNFVKTFSRSRLKKLYQRLYARACLVVAALERKYKLKADEMSQKGVFHPAANARRCKSMLQVELRKIRLEVLEVDVLEEMAYEEAERRWREAHPDGEDPPMDSDAIVLGTIRNPNAGAVSAAQLAAERRKMLEKEATQQRWELQCTVEPAVRMRALGGAMNAKFIKQREAKPRRLIGQPVTEQQMRPWRRGGRGRLSRAKAREQAAAEAENASSNADADNNTETQGVVSDNQQPVETKEERGSKSHSSQRLGSHDQHHEECSDYAEHLLVRCMATIDVTKVRSICAPFVH